MRIVIWLSIVLLALAIGWHYRALWLGLAGPPPAPPRPVVFDNGSVRDQRPASQPAGPPVVTAAPGQARKCVKRGETTYTNFACPPGFKEAAIASDRVTVVPGTSGAPPAAAKPQGEAPSALHEALDLKRDEELRRRIMDRAIEGR